MSTGVVCTRSSNLVIRKFLHSPIRWSSQLCRCDRARTEHGRLACGCSLAPDNATAVPRSMPGEVVLMGAADWDQQLGAITTPTEVCRNHERAEILDMFIKKKKRHTFVLGETPEPMSGIVLRNKGLA